MKKPVKKAAKKAVAASKAKKAAPAAKKAKPVPPKKVAKAPEKKPLKAVAPAKKPAPAPAKKEEPKKAPPMAAKGGFKKEVQEKVVAGKGATGKGPVKAPQGATKAPPAPLKVEPKLIETPEPEFVRPQHHGDLFSTEELATFKSLLESERGKILAKARRAVEEGNIQIDKNDLMDEVDQASAMVEQNLTFRLLDRDRKLLSEIDHAIAKLETGDYGYCEGTGEPIPKRRLELRPWCRHSVKYKEKLERMKKSGRGVVDEDEL